MGRIEEIRARHTSNFANFPDSYSAFNQAKLDIAHMLSQLEQATGLLTRSKPFIQYAKEYNYAGDILDTDIAAFLNQK